MQTLYCEREGLNNSDLRQAVAAPSHGFHKARTLGGIAEGITNLVDSLVEPVVEIDKSVSRPKFFLQFLPGYDLAGVLHQHREDLKGLLLQPNL
jgi:hypothetical protein